jgi:hypothetical protein
MNKLKDTLVSASNNLVKIYQKSSFVLSLLVTIIGFIVFSYVVQEDKCFIYDDWRRPFTIVSFIILGIVSSLAVLSFALSVKMSDKTGKYGGLLVRLLIIILGLFLVSLLYIPTINLMWKSRTSFEMIDIGSDVKHPKQKNWTMIVAGLLIYGSLIPLGKEIGNVIVGQSLVDSAETEQLLNSLRVSSAS